MNSTVKEIKTRVTLASEETRASFGVWDPMVAEDRKQWLSHWEAWPTQEVAAHPDYVQLFVPDESQRVMAAYWKSEKGNVLYPFILRPIDTSSDRSDLHETWYDITSPYGYGGPFYWHQRESHRDEITLKFWRCFDEWAETQRVVSEFVRFSLFADKLLDFPGDCISKLTNVVCNLSQSEQVLWRNVKPKVRRNVNKARREGVTVARDDSGEFLEDFQRIYASTMNRRKAHPHYYFSPTFFKTLNNRLAGQYSYFHATYQEKVISSELVLISSENVYFFLGGTDSQYYSLRPNELLKYEIMCWAREQGKKNYVLGGGYEEKDGIFQFKEAFAPEGLVTFRVGQKVHNQIAYDLLSERKSSDGSFFPRYRVP